MRRLVYVVRMVLPISLTLSEGLDVAMLVFWVTWMYGGVKESRKEGATGMSFVWGCCFHASFQILGNPDVRCHSCIKIHLTGLSVVRVTTFVVHRGWSRQCGKDNVDRPGNFHHGDS